MPGPVLQGSMYASLQYGLVDQDPARDGDTPQDLP